MARLRQVMLEALRRRNCAESTIATYIHTVEHFSRYFHRRPDQLGLEQIAQYQAALLPWRLADIVTLRLAALRFFYVQVLSEAGALPDTLSQEGVASSGDTQPGGGRASDRRGRVSLPSHPADDTSRHGRTSRRVAHLKISDIDAADALPLSLGLCQPPQERTISRCNCRPPPPKATLQIIRTCSATYKPHRLPRGAASFKSL